MSTTAPPRITFACPDCGRSLKADVSKVGKKARCKGCGKAVTVPGLAEPPPRPALDDFDLPASVRPPLDDADVELVDEPAEKRASQELDASAGPASLYLGGVSLVLFLSVMMSFSVFLGIGKWGLALLAIMAAGGLALSWKGWQLAKVAGRRALATGQGGGYALAGQWSHGLIAVNYIAMVALVGIYTYALSSGAITPGTGGGLGGLDLGGLMKTLQGAAAEQNKLIDEINKR